MSIPLPGRILPLAPGTLRALENRDFRLLWIGLLVSVVALGLLLTVLGKRSAPA